MAHKFWAKVRKTDTCWAWVGTIQHGYGLVNQNGKRKQAHRVAYEYAKGPIPSGVVLDHLCRNRWCVNPDHLEPVTNRENVLRGQSVQADNARKDRCPQGHPYDEANTSRMPDGSRRCKRCRSDHSKAKTAEAKHQRSMLT